MNFKEILDCLIEREEHIQAELAKPDSETMEGTLFQGNLGWKTDEKGNVYFFVGDMHYLTFVCLLVLTPEQMKAYICYENPSWNKEIEKMIKENPDDLLHEILYTWFMKHPGITDILTFNLNASDNKYLSKKDVQDDPFDIYRPQEIFCGESWYGMMRYLLWNEPEPIFIQRKIKGKFLSSFNQFFLVFREAVAVHSLKEIESLQSAICYLIYRKDWMNRHRNMISTKMASGETYKSYSNYISKHPDYLIFDFFGSRNIFDGQLWSSYDEFMHDEWLDDEFPETFNDMPWHFEFYAKLYRDLRNAAFHKK